MAADLLDQPLSVRVGDDGIVTIEMHDVANRNALTAAFQERLVTVLADAHTDPRARVVVLTGLPDIFCSGASRAVLHDLVDGRFEHLELSVTGAMLATRLPVIAAMEGSAVGGGFVLGLAADVVIMAETSRYGMNFIDYGITPGMGATRILEHVLSPAMAHELLYTAEMRRGAGFKGCSGINAILPRAEVRPHALDLAARIAEKPRLALETLKAHLSLPRRRIHEECRTREAMMFQICASAPDLKARIAATYPE